MMDDARTLWLVLANLALGATVLVFCVLVVVGLAREFIGRVRRRRAYRAELSRDLESYLRRTHKS